MPCFLYREEPLTDLDREILHLGEETHGVSDSKSPPGSPKRARSQDEADEYELALYGDDADGESDEELQTHLPKKRRRTGRRIPSVEARSAALQELNDHQTSKRARRFDATAAIQDTAARTSGKQKRPKQKKKRRLPMDELVTVSERPRDSDVEVADGEFLLRT